MKFKKENFTSGKQIRGCQKQGWEGAGGWEEGVSGYKRATREILVALELYRKHAHTHRNASKTVEIIVKLEIDQCQYPSCDTVLLQNVAIGGIWVKCILFKQPTYIKYDSQCHKVLVSLHML